MRFWGWDRDAHRFADCESHEVSLAHGNFYVRHIYRRVLIRLRASLPTMQGTQWKRLGVFAFLDTGPPSLHQKDYVTLVMVHGRGGTAGPFPLPTVLSLSRGVPSFADFFARFLPLAGKLGARVVAINRRDYPGSAPFSEEDHALLLSTTHDTPAASENADRYMKARARELYDFLTQLVKSEELPINSIILAGWSLGTAFVNSFLAYAPSFESWGAGLSQYIRRVIAYGASPGSARLVEWNS